MYPTIFICQLNAPHCRQAVFRQHSEVEGGTGIFNNLDCRFRGQITVDEPEGAPVEEPLGLELFEIFVGYGGKDLGHSFFLGGCGG